MQGLDPKKLIETSEQLNRGIGKAFPKANLRHVAESVQNLTSQAIKTAEYIRRPIWSLRIPIFILGIVVLAGAGHQVYTHQLKEILKFLDDTKGASLYIMAAIGVFVTLEIRWKRRRAIKAVNELRAMAHIIDMHQITKDETIVTLEKEYDVSQTKAYLHACTILLSITSKLGQLYVEHFPDPVAVNSVNQFEAIATGLSTKIWAKINSMKDQHANEPLSTIEFWEESDLNDK